MTDQRASVNGAPAAETHAGPELGVIVPTYNERDNLPILVQQIARALDGVDWEIIIVDDDSPDGTSAVASQLGGTDRRVRCIRRIGRRGLSSACIEGMLASQARYVAVIDADLQHDETLLPAMLDKLRGGNVDLVVASRFCEGAEETALSARRARGSRFAIAFARRFLGVQLTDPLSGFFMMRRDRFNEAAPSLATQGFKILLDIATTAHGRLRAVELPFVFGKRMRGESKLDARVVLDFIELLVAKLTNNAVSFRFLLFCLVGATGVAVHMAALALLHALASQSFGIEQAIATTLAIAWNFVLNNAFTYRSHRLTGLAFVGGLLRFELVCGFGAIANIGIASLIYGNEGTWWVAGLGGALMSAVWNYVVSAAFVWRVR